MRPIGGPRRDRNAFGRWQDRRDDRHVEPYGQARQASWTYIALLIVACGIVTVAWLWSLSIRGGGHGGRDGGASLFPSVESMPLSGADR